MKNHDKNALHEKHLQAVQNKHWALEGKEAIHAMWEGIEYDNYPARRKNKDDDSFEDHRKYILGLRHRIRNLLTQLKAMRPGARGEDNL